MKHTKIKLSWEQLRSFVVRCLAISMLIVIVVFIVDAILYDMQKYLFTICSILLLSIVVCAIQKILEPLAENYPIATLFIDYLLVVVGFILFKNIFHWYEGINVLLVFVYTLPVFVISYLLRLVGVSKDARVINEKLAQRRKKKDNL